MYNKVEVLPVMQTSVMPVLSGCSGVQTGAPRVAYTGHPSLDQGQQHPVQINNDMRETGETRGIPPGRHTCQWDCVCGGVGGEWEGVGYMP